MAAVTLSHVWKRYTSDAPPAVRDFSLEIPHNEFLVFVGPSGCGKSTTLRMIAGLEDVTEGTIQIGDRVVNDVAPKDRNISMVFQNYALYPTMNVFENVAFSLRLQKLQKYLIGEKVKGATDALGIHAFVDRLPHQLSGGQRQRVALGRAIVREPHVFLMDEPLSNLDAKMRVQMRLELSRLHQELDATTIYVTHDQVEAMTMGDRIVVMKDGVIQQVGTPEEIYSSPANIFVGSFIGAPPMNFVSGRIAPGFTGEADESMWFIAQGIKLLIPPERRALLKRRLRGSDVVVAGIRPEHIEVDDVRGGRENAGSGITGTVILQELVGADRLLYIDIHEKAPLIVRTAPRNRFNRNDAASLWVDPDQLLLFDPQSGHRIL
ncbi:MAG: ABC transporter ATP-binding protein [Spirochaetota bacterium]